VLEIGSFLISLQPPGAKQVVVDLFGTNDKLALNLAIIIGALVIAAGLGMLARYHRPWTTAGFVAIAALGLFASLRDPLVDGLLAVVAAVVGVTVAYTVIGWLLKLATPSGEAQMPDWGRRRFIGTAVAVGAGGIAGGSIGRLLLNDRAEAAPTSASIPPAVDPVAALPAGAKLAVQGITPLVVPNAHFYRIDTNLLTPRVDASSWTLSVDGMVDHPFSITYDELLAMEMHEEYVTIACVSNEVGGDLVGNALWEGRSAPRAPRPGRRAVGRHADRGALLRSTGRPVSQPPGSDDPSREALVAVAMNGDPLPAEHGFPARLIVPGLYGYVSATKWLTRIGLTTLEAFNGYWVPLGWAKEAPILTQSRIDVPQSGSAVNAGQVAVAGVAWAPDRGVYRVEVQVDDAPWAAAEISAPISDATWVQWLFRWAATPGNHSLSVRATDGKGDVQTAKVTRPAPDGARGHHTIDVQVNG